ALPAALCHREDGDHQHHRRRRQCQPADAGGLSAVRRPSRDCRLPRFTPRCARRWERARMADGTPRLYLVYLDADATPRPAPELAELAPGLYLVRPGALAWLRATGDRDA